MLCPRRTSRGSLAGDDHHIECTVEKGFRQLVRSSVVLDFCSSLTPGPRLNTLRACAHLISQRVTELDAPGYVIECTRPGPRRHYGVGDSRRAVWGSNIGSWPCPADLRVLVFDHAAMWYSLVSPSMIGLRRTWWLVRLITCGGWVSAWRCELRQRSVWPRCVEMVQINHEDPA
jgi:hypothetical protein